MRYWSGVVHQGQNTGVWASGLCVGAVLFAGSATAQSISPVLIELSPARPVSSVTLSNTTDHARLFQVDGLAWTQRDGADAYERSAELLVTSAIVEIPAGESQVFRVARRGPPAFGSEEAYRLILEDITEAAPPSQTAAQVNLRLRFSLPVFATPSASGQPAPAWSLCDAPVGKGCIRLDNNGAKRFRFSRLQGETETWRGPIVRGDTVLAGAWKSWLFDMPPATAGPFTVTALVAGRAVTATVGAAPGR